MAWILHSLIRAFPDLAQALCGSVRGQDGFMASRPLHCNIDQIIQQALQQKALIIAQSYKDQFRWGNAATALRAPYWDWATNSVPPPEVVSLTTVSILRAPDETPTVVWNPLYQYTFHPIPQSFPPPYNSWQTTIRSPDTRGPGSTTNVNRLIRHGFPLSESSISHSVFSPPKQTKINAD